MIIDLILDRKVEAKEYSPRSFYNDLMQYYYVFPQIVEPIATALEGGNEQDIKYELCKYVKDQEYNKSICDYIKSVNWL